MKKLFLMVAMVVISLMAMAQTNQLVWANGQLLYATPTDKVDSLTYDASFEGDTLFFIMPHKLVQTVHDTVFVHDTVYEQEIVYVHDTIYINNCEPEEPETTHEYVDLGLSVKWATCNVGATTPEEYGDYFAWGEVEPKTTYDWSTYKYGTNYDQLTKYCSNSSYGKDGFVDNKTVLDPEDDAATANWGGAWRMPTKAEQDELRNNCTWIWTTQNGVNGYKVTGPNGNSIFLPAAGCMHGGTLYNAGSLGFYWSSSLLTVSPSSAYSVSFDSVDVDWNGYFRYFGFTVRPVCK
jgi:hypothetical protein